MADAAYNSGSHLRATGKCNGNSSAFIAALLEPLPAGEEPADTPAFRKQMLAEAKMVWSGAMTYVQEAEALHKMWAMRWQRGRSVEIEAHLAIASVLRRQATEAQCLIPAPTLAELRWKRRAMQAHDIPAAVAAAIAADEARLGAKVVA